MNIPVFILIWLAFRGLQVLPSHPDEPQAANASDRRHLRETLSSKAVWTLAIFLMLYVGYVLHPRC